MRTTYMPKISKTMPAQHSKFINQDFYVFFHPPFTERLYIIILRSSSSEIHESLFDSMTFFKTEFFPKVELLFPKCELLFPKCELLFLKTELLFLKVELLFLKVELLFLKSEALSPKVEALLGKRASLS